MAMPGLSSAGSSTPPSPRTVAAGHLWRDRLGDMLLGETANRTGARPRISLETLGGTVLWVALTVPALAAVTHAILWAYGLNHRWDCYDACGRQCDAATGMPSRGVWCDKGWAANSSQWKWEAVIPDLDALNYDVLLAVASRPGVRVKGTCELQPAEARPRPTGFDISLQHTAAVFGAAEGGWAGWSLARGEPIGGESGNWTVRVDATWTADEDDDDDYDPSGGRPAHAVVLYQEKSYTVAEAIIRIILLLGTLALLPGYLYKQVRSLRTAAGEMYPEQLWIAVLLLVCVGYCDPTYLPLLWSRQGGTAAEVNTSFQHLFVFLFHDIFPPFLLLLLCGTAVGKLRRAWFQCPCGDGRVGFFWPSAFFFVWAALFCAADVVQFAGWSSGPYDAARNGGGEERASTASAFHFARPLWLLRAEQSCRLAWIVLVVLGVCWNYYFLRTFPFTSVRMRMLCFRVFLRCCLPVAGILCGTKLADQFPARPTLQNATKYSSLALQDLLPFVCLLHALAIVYTPVHTPRRHFPPRPDHGGWLTWKWSPDWLWWRYAYGRSLYFFLTERERVQYFASQAADIGDAVQAKVEEAMECEEHPVRDPSSWTGDVVSDDEQEHLQRLRGGQRRKGEGHSGSRHRIDSVYMPRFTHASISSDPIKRMSTRGDPSRRASSPRRERVGSLKELFAAAAQAAGPNATAGLASDSAARGPRSPTLDPGAEGRGSPVLRLGNPEERTSFADGIGDRQETAGSIGRGGTLRFRTQTMSSPAVEGTDSTNDLPDRTMPTAVSGGVNSVSPYQCLPANFGAVFHDPNTDGASATMFRFGAPEDEPTPSSRNSAGAAANAVAPPAEQPAPFQRLHTRRGTTTLRLPSAIPTTSQRGDLSHLVLDSSDVRLRFARTNSMRSPKGKSAADRADALSRRLSGTTVSHEGGRGHPTPPSSVAGERSQRSGSVAVSREPTNVFDAQRSLTETSTNAVYSTDLRRVEMPRLLRRRGAWAGFGRRGSSAPNDDHAEGATPQAGQNAVPEDAAAGCAAAAREARQADGWFCLEAAVECLNAAAQAYCPESSSLPYADLATASLRREAAGDSAEPYGSEADCAGEAAVTQWFEDCSGVPSEYLDFAPDSKVWPAGFEEAVAQARSETWQLAHAFLSGVAHAKQRLLPMLFGIGWAERWTGCQRVDMIVDYTSQPSEGRPMPSAVRHFGGPGVWEAAGEGQTIRIAAWRGSIWMEARRRLELTVQQAAAEHCRVRSSSSSSTHTRDSHGTPVVSWSKRWRRLIGALAEDLDGPERTKWIQQNLVEEQSLSRWLLRELHSAGCSGGGSPVAYFRAAAHVRGLLHVLCGLPFDEVITHTNAAGGEVPLPVLAEELRSEFGPDREVVYNYPYPERRVGGAVEARELVQWIRQRCGCPSQGARVIAERLREQGVLQPVARRPVPMCVDGALWRVAPAAQAPSGAAAQCAGATPERGPKPIVPSEPIHPEAYGYRLEAVITLPLHQLRAVVVSSEARVILSFRGTANAENAKLDLACCKRGKDDDAYFSDIEGMKRSWLEAGQQRGARISKLAGSEGCDARRCCRSLLSKAPWDATPSCHDGFLTGWELIQENVLEVVRRVCPVTDARPLYVTGHSLGGALAQIAAYYISNKLYNWQPCDSTAERQKRRASGEEKQVRVYCFSSPRVGNVAFRAFYDLVVPETFIVSVVGDPVTAMPYSLWTCTAWSHVGYKFVLGDGACASWVVDPNWLDTSATWYPKNPQNHFLRFVGNQLNLVVDYLCESWAQNKCYHPAGGLFSEGVPHYDADTPTSDADRIAGDEAAYLGPWFPVPAGVGFPVAPDPYPSSLTLQSTTCGKDGRADSACARESPPTTPGDDGFQDAFGQRLVTVDYGAATPPSISGLSEGAMGDA